MKRKLNIFPCFLLITGLVIFSHSIVPHDHHSDGSIAHNESNEDNSKSDHCNLLNNITFDKAISITKKIVSKPHLGDSDLIFFTNKSFVKNRYGILRLRYIDNISDFLVFIDNYPTRGSPTV